MKTILPVAISAVILTACLGGGGGGELYGLTAGDYLTSNGAVQSDGCGLGVTGDDLNGDVLLVSTSDGIVTIDGEDYPRSGNSFGRTQFMPAQQVSSTCTVDVNLDETGSIIGPDSMLLSLRIDVSNPIGSGCAAAIPVSLPCFTQASFHADLQ